MLFLISQERMILELNHNAKSKGRGVLNWYVDTNYLHAYYSVFGITYYLQLLKEEVGESLKQFLDSRSQILGLPEEEEDEEIPSLDYDSVVMNFDD